MYLVVTQLVLLRWHYTVTTIADRLANLFSCGTGFCDRPHTVQPNIVRQIRRAGGVRAFSVGTVAGSTGSEYVFTGLSLSNIMIATAKAHYVLSYVNDPFFAQNFAPSKHPLSLTAINKSMLNGFRAAAIEPVVVGEIGETVVATGI